MSYLRAALVCLPENRNASARRDAMLEHRQHLIGRGHELADLMAAIARARDGQGTLCLLEGEPGIGKTRLADELALRVGTADVRVLWGRCWDTEGRPPYWPWAQILRALLRHVPIDAARDGGATALARVGQVATGPATTLESVAAAAPESGAARFQLFDAVVRHLRAAAEATPLVLVLDDLHAADLPSLRLLEFLAHALSDTRVLVVGTYRPIEARREPLVAEALATLGRIGHRMPLAGLTREEVGLFVERVAGGGAPTALVQRIHRETEGNPLFVEEVVRWLRARPEDERWELSMAAALPLSGGIRGAVRQRLAPLDPDSHRLLAAAAVLGREFDLALLAALCDLGIEQTLDGLAAPLEHALVARVRGAAGRYRFAHALIRDAIYEELPPAERVRLHRTSGRAIEARYGPRLEAQLPALSHHFFEAAVAGEDDRAKGVTYAERAGHQASALLAYEEAAEQYERALHLLESAPAADPRHRCELLLALGDVRNRAGEDEAARRALRGAVAAARELDAPTLLAVAAIRLCEVIGLFWTEFGRRDEELTQLLEEALASLGEDEPALRARVLTRLATENCWAVDPKWSESVSRDAVVLARRSGDPAALAYALLGRVFFVSRPEQFAERAVLVDEILSLTQQARDREVAVNALMWRFGDAWQAGDLAVARATAAEMVRLVKDLRRPADQWIIPTVESQAALLEGRFVDAERFAEAIAAQPTRVGNAVQVASAALFRVRRERGLLGDLEAGLKVLVAQYPDVAVWRASLGVLYTETGRDDAARAELAALMEKGLAQIRPHLTWTYTMACLADVASVAGTGTDAAPIYDALRPHDGRNVVAGPFYFGPVAYYLGRLATRMARWEDAARHLDDALAQATAVGARPYAAYALAGRAWMLVARRGRGDAAVAIDAAAHARAIAEPLGMEALLARLRTFRDGADEPGSDPPGAATGPGWAAFRQEGDFWIVAYEGRVHHLRGVKGFRYIAALLAEPGRDFHVLDLVGALHGQPEPMPGTGPGVRRARGALVRAEAGEPILDQRARREIGRRLEELRAQVEEAERFNDLARASLARDEIEAITAGVASAIGLRGGDRRMRTASERARASVTKAIRSAVRLIRRTDPALAGLLARTIRTGAFCRYEPLPQMPIAWRLND